MTAKLTIYIVQPLVMGYKLINKEKKIYSIRNIRPIFMQSY